MSEVRKISNGIQSFIDDLKRQLPNKSTEIGLDAVDMITSRIIETGKNAQGSDLRYKGKVYSDTEVPAFFFKNKSRTGSAEAMVQSFIDDGETLSYEEFRQINNLPTDHVTLSFTSRMWNAFTVIEVIDQTGAVKIKLGTRQTEEAEKLQYQVDRYGPILQVSEIEKGELNQSLLTFVEQTFRKHL